MSPVDPFAYRVAEIEEVVRRSREFDVIHSHVEYLPWLAAGRLQAPVVTTLHGRLDLPELQPLFAAHPEQPLVSISDSQRRPVVDLDLNWVATVYHGFPLANMYPMGAGDGGYLAFLGRMSPEKAPHVAIRVAIRAGLPIKVAARIDAADEGYFVRKVQPLLEHPLVHWLGEIDDSDKARLLGDAMALLLPIEWDEPFGIAFIEALAAGTPVISRPSGSLPELLRHGEHGFLVWTEDELVRACHSVGEIDRLACRTHVVERFSARRMADGYERAFRMAIAGQELARIGLTSAWAAAAAE
jgi:glycosyltransferase involved in cell wall biosynthesis